MAREPNRRDRRPIRAGRLGALGLALGLEAVLHRAARRDEREVVLARVALRDALDRLVEREAREREPRRDDGVGARARVVERCLRDRVCRGS